MSDEMNSKIHWKDLEYLSTDVNKPLLIFLSSRVRKANDLFVLQQFVVQPIK